MGFTHPSDFPDFRDHMTRLLTLAVQDRQPSDESRTHPLRGGGPAVDQVVSRAATQIGVTLERRRTVLRVDPRGGRKEGITMKKTLFAVLLTIAALMGSTPANASWYDAQQVRHVIYGAVTTEPTSTYIKVCRKWRKNPTAKLFQRFTIISRDRFDISMRDAARGVVLGMRDACS
jgi:hypothetical protein